jgi:hypothetical protein
VLSAVALTLVIGVVVGFQVSTTAEPTVSKSTAKDPGPTDRATSTASASAEPRTLAPSVVVMSLPESAGPMERPPVEFDHARHTSALEEEDCETCHSLSDKGLDPVLKAATELADRQLLIDAYHGSCMGCHRDRADRGLTRGPVTCGECHVRRPQGAAQRIAMAFDYSLHARHARAFPEKCDTCHHVYDEALQKLVYQKNTEESCGSCHGPEDVDQTPSLANASHRDCVSCHLRRTASQLEAGPVLCVGCHDESNRREIDRLEEVPRLQRGQPDTVWIAAADARSRVVAFNHQAHEPLTRSCSDCHHQRLKACKECHTLIGTEEGAGITVAVAFHLSSSEHSCVGCHAANAGDRSCSGCHRQLGRPPAERTCTVCHYGPQPGSEPLELPPPVPDEVRVEPLPGTSDDFPESIVIDRMVEHYEASTLPHSKIVSKLDAAVRESPLAGRFHVASGTLCAGCHHHSPVGTRPPPCRSCHGETADAITDKPGLRVAYHRQCVGCHIEMGIPKQGCTDCHAVKEVQS